jgi:hypothetical protein
MLAGLQHQKNGFVVSITTLLQPYLQNHVFVIRLSPRLS